MLLNITVIELYLAIFTRVAIQFVDIMGTLEEK